MKKKLLAAILALVMAVTMLPLPASAAFTKRTAAPETNNKYYYDKSYNSLQQNQCTWYAWGRAYEITGVRPRWSAGNANTWHTSAKNAGYTVGSTPKVGAIANWGSAWNHVVVVEEIKSNGNLLCSQANRKGNAFLYEEITDSTCRYDSGTPIKVGKPTYYIYLLDDGGTTAPAKTTITFSSLTVPDTLTEGTDAMLDGSFAATNNKICNVKAEVCDASNGAVKLSATSGGNFSVWTYGPLTNSKLNTDLDLGKLKAGTYYVRYTVTTQDGTTASRSTANFTVTHTWGGWITTKAASCGVAGLRKRTCSRCGQAETQTIAALSHSYQKTSSAAAYDVYTCSSCKGSYRVNKVAWVQNSFGENGARSVSIRNSGDTAFPCCCLIARYEGGRLVSLTQEVLNIPAGASENVATGIPLGTGDETWRVFVLDGRSHAPLLPNLEY